MLAEGEEEAGREEDDQSQDDTWHLFMCCPCGERSTSVKLIDKHIREYHGAEFLRQARGLLSAQGQGLSAELGTVQEGCRGYWLVCGDASLEPSDESRCAHDPTLRFFYEPE